jgi:hypothetical protein
LEIMETNASAHESDLETRWRLRENQWRGELGRIRLGVEPIEEQLARYRRVTWALTVLPLISGLMFFSLFTVFGRPLIGLCLAAILLVSIGLGAWLDYALLARRAGRYLGERAIYLREKEKLTERAPATNTTSEPG